MQCDIMAKNYFCNVLTFVFTISDIIVIARISVKYAFYVAHYKFALTGDTYLASYGNNHASIQG